MCISNSSVLLTFSVDFVNTRTLETSLVLQPQQTRKWCVRVTSAGTDSPSSPSLQAFFCHFVLPVVIPMLLFCRQSIKLALIFQAILQVYHADIELQPRG